MNMPRTFYEEFQSRWPRLFREIEKYVERQPPPPPDVLPEDAMPHCWDDMADELLAGAKNPLMRELVSAVRMELGGRRLKENEDFYKSIISVADTLIAFMLYHRRTFFVQPNLVQRLAHTALDIDVADLIVPFPMTMLVFDDPISREAAPHWEFSGPVSVLVDYVERNGEPKLRISPVAPRPQVRMPIVFELPTSGRLTEAVAKEIPLAKIVANALDYIAHPWDGDAPATVRAAPSHTLSKKVSKLPYIVVGRRYQPMDTPPLGTGTGHKLDHRVFVMGHGRNQRHGPRNSLIKRIRIEPYWKGPEDAEVADAPYVVV